MGLLGSVLGALVVLVCALGCSMVGPGRRWRHLQSRHLQRLSGVLADSDPDFGLLPGRPFGLYGYFRDTSPNLDHLASMSLVFDDAIAPMATTLPTT